MENIQPEHKNMDRNDQGTAKRQWMKPDIEVISNSSIQQGSNPYGHEGVPTLYHFGFYSS